MGYFAVLLAAHVIVLHTELFVLGCSNLVHSGTMLLIICPSAIIAAIFLGISLGKFKDNFKIYLELRHTVIAYCFIYPILLGLATHGIFFNPRSWLTLVHLMPYVAQVFFIIAALPLLYQRKLDHKVKDRDFEHLENLDDVLAEPAALVALEQFMRLEFTEELLEFYGVFR